jgi:hypothetical protein
MHERRERIYKHELLDSVLSFAAFYFGARIKCKPGQRKSVYLQIDDSSVTATDRITKKSAQNIVLVMLPYSALRISLRAVSRAKKIPNVLGTSIHILLPLAVPSHQYQP